VEFLDQSFGAQCRQIVAQRREPILVGGGVERRGGGRMQILRREGIAIRSRLISWKPG